MAKYTPETKISACKEYLEGKLSHQEICQKYGITFNKSACKSMINEWIPRYLAAGEAAFFTSKGNNEYSSIEKKRIVKEYLAGEGSLTNISAKYNIPSKETLRKWVNAYTSNNELKDYAPKSGVHTKKAERKVSRKERREISKYCLEHDRDYKGTAAKFHVSYQQVAM